VNVIFGEHNVDSSTGGVEHVKGKHMPFLNMERVWKGYDGGNALNGILKSNHCYLMSCSNEGKHARIGGSKRSPGALKCCWKGKVLLSTCVKASRSKGH
jgi:hypothetical protein